MTFPIAGSAASIHSSLILYLVDAEYITLSLLRNSTMSAFPPWSRQLLNIVLIRILICGLESPTLSFLIASSKSEYETTPSKLRSNTINISLKLRSAFTMVSNM
uniref:Uncharacterized protein n=1 Tax=Babesia bovis TaxID=5865 RepID=S6C9M9_BABBO|nr:hypothetical protein [Babesia bovis]